MKILVLGGSGLIGDDFITNSKSHNIITTYKNNETKFSNIFSLKINLPQDWEKLQDLIQKEKPDVVLNSIAYSNSDFCEKNKEDTFTLHVNITDKITALCTKINSKIVFLSTDYVFDGKKGTYTENDKTNPINYYGYTKDLAEKIILKNENNLVLRTSMVYGSSPKVRFLRYVIENLKNCQAINAYNDIFNSATLLADLTSGILKAIETNATGIFHMAGSSCVSRFDFAKTIAKIFGFDVNLVKPTSIISAKLDAQTSY